MPNEKIISDAVHGPIGLSKLELDIIGTKIFQRLRRVKQLGLADFVFPSAGYSRFSHSLGVCHVTGQIFDNLAAGNNESELAEKVFDVESRKYYRIAGLLHDIGHYAFSHALEKPLIRYQQEQESKGGQQVLSLKDSANADLANLKHESVSKLIVSADPELQEIFKRHSIDKVRVYDAFKRQDPIKNPLQGIISSDLDADRIDYLLRTSKHTGLPYGSVDKDYLISQFTLNPKTRDVCLSRKALRAVDQLLVARYFDYHQVCFHKTVVIFEQLLKDLVYEMLSENKIELTKEKITEAVKAGLYSHCDDNWLWNQVVDYVPTTRAMKLKKEALLSRQAPKLIASKEYFIDRKGTESYTKLLRAQRQIVAAELKVEEELFVVWDHTEPLTRSDGSAQSEQANAELVQIYDKNTGECKPIIDYEESLMNVLKTKAQYIGRLYYLQPQGGPSVAEVKEKFSKSL